MIGNEELFKLMKQRAKYIEQSTKPLSQLAEQLKPTINMFKEIAKQIRPVTDIMNQTAKAIDREYNVDKIKYNNAIKELHDKGYYLSILASPREYIEMNSYSNDQLEIMYLKLFEDKDGNLTSLTDEILEIMEELVYLDWEKTIKQSIKVIRDNGIDDSCMLVMPLYFCYLEFIIRDRLPLKGQDFIGFNNLFSGITNLINENRNYSSSQKEFFSVLATSTFKNYYKFAQGEELGVISRNTLFHGYIGADKITKLDFYKQISLLSQIVYFFSMYDNTDINIEQ